MKVSSSYGVEIGKKNICFRKTVEIYREACGFLVSVLDSAWEELSLVKGDLRRFNEAEHMVHTTKRNRARFDFDIRFPKMPSYLRRSAIQFALGTVSSYHTRLSMWEKENSRISTACKPSDKADTSGRPVLQAVNHAAPVFYHDVMFKKGAPDADKAFLKLYDGRDWVWKEVRLKHTDMQYLRKHWTGRKASAPVLEKHYKKYFLRFTYTEDVSLPGTPAQEQTVCAVDLGINTDAVCTAMKSDGTVLARKFIDFPSEKDHLKHVLGRISRFQREHGPARCKRRWAYAVALNGELARKTARAIVAFAMEQHADVIVFEHLEMHGKIHGRRKQRLHMWKKDTIQEICTHQAHRRGIRVSRICPWNTSALAFDGSGKVERDPGNHSLCRFRNGKQYNCDLSASYNIGARYFIREILKPLPATVRSLLEAEVPSVKRRTSCVYADLLALNGAIKKRKAA